MALGLWKLRSSGQFGNHRGSDAQWIGWGGWRFSDSVIDAMGMAQAIMALTDIKMQGGAAIAFEFVKPGLETIGSSDALAETSLNYSKDAKQREFCRKIFRRRDEDKKERFQPWFLQTSYHCGK